MKNLDLLNSDPRERKGYYLADTRLRRMMIAVSRGLIRLAATWKVSGVENIPAAGPVVLAANHLTNFDALIVQFVIPRPIFFMGKAELFAGPMMEPIYRHLGGFPVFRGAQDEWAMHHAERILLNSQVLGIFPEGSRSKGRGLQTGKTGAARLALALKCPILPVGLHGTQTILRSFPRRARVQLTIGAPILPSPDDTALSLTDRMMYALAGVLPPALRGVYAQKPAGFDV